MNDYIVWAIIIVILAWAMGYIILQKRKGVKCVGCASEAQCSGSKQSRQQCAYYESSNGCSGAQESDVIH